MNCKPIMTALGLLAITVFSGIAFASPSALLGVTNSDSSGLNSPNELLAQNPDWMRASLPWIQTHVEDGAFRVRPAGSAGPHFIAPYPQAIADDFGALDPVTGLLYVLGGTTGSETKATGFVYHPVTDSWTPIADAPVARASAAVGFMGGKLYVVGGWDAAGNPATELDIYDPATDSWTIGAPDPMGQGGGVAHAVLNGKLYVVGGCNDGGCSAPLTAVEVYSPASDSWSTASEYPEPVTFASCGGINGKLYCAGNLGPGGNVLGYAYAYDPAIEMWSSIPDMPQPQAAAFYAAANGSLLVVKGYASTPSGIIITNQAEAYDPTTNAWSSLFNGQFAAARGASACGFYMVGGIISSPPPPSNAVVWPGYDQCGY